MATGHTDRGPEMENKDQPLCTIVDAQSRGPPGAGESRDLSKWTDPGHHDCSRLGSGRGKGQGGCDGTGLLCEDGLVHPGWARGMGAGCEVPQ